MRYVGMPMVAILTLLIISIHSINSAHPSLQQESVISNQGMVPVQDNFADAIFFEYGAESGVLQPPWDVVGPHGGPSEGRGSVTVDTTHVRTGDEALEFWQDDGTSDAKLDGDRRVELRYVSTKKEFYVSWWAYFETFPTGTRTTLGGTQAFFGPSGDKWRWWTSTRFMIHQGTGHHIQFSYTWGTRNGYTSNFSDTATALGEVWYTNYELDDYFNQWIHFQVYIKWSTNNNGIVTAWFNNNVVANKTGIKTDPEGYSEWNENNCIYAYGQPYPFIVIEHYGRTDSPSSSFWVDDIVAATQKVPDVYLVSN